MIIGVGTDIIDVARMDKVLKNNPRFVEKVFTTGEIAYCEARAHKAQSYAARFAAKEAVMKALGTGWDKGVAWHDIDIQHDAEGRPGVRLSGVTATLYAEKGMRRIHLSLSHEKGFAIAFAIAEQ